MSEEKRIELPDLEALEAELERTRYRKRYGSVLRSTAFSLVQVLLQNVCGSLSSSSWLCGHSHFLI